MRVLHVINQISARAGAELSLRDIIAGTQDERLRHGLAVLRADEAPPPEFDRLGVPVLAPPHPLGSTRSKVQHVRAAIRAFRPDLVHTTLFEADVAGRLAARRERVPVLTSLVNTSYTAEAIRSSGVSPLKLRGVQVIDATLSHLATDAFHAITGAVADAAASSLRIRRDRITVVPRGRSRASLGTASPQRRAAARAMLGVGEDTPVLLSVGRQEAQKGQQFLIEALPRILARSAGAVLLLAGREGNRTPLLRQRIGELGLDDAVRVLGMRTDVAALLCAADVFVFPSLYEGLGGAVIEAMALRAPIVASDLPTLREVLAGGRCGLLVPPGAPEPLANAVLDVLTERAAAAGRVDAAEQRFEDTYELGRCLEGMRCLYRDLAHRFAITPPPP